MEKRCFVFFKSLFALLIIGFFASCSNVFKQSASVTFSIPEEVVRMAVQQSRSAIYRSEDEIDQETDTAKDDENETDTEDNLENGMMVISVEVTGDYTAKKEEKFSLKDLYEKIQNEDESSPSDAEVLKEGIEFIFDDIKPGSSVFAVAQVELVYEGEQPASYIIYKGSSERLTVVAGDSNLLTVVLKSPASIKCIPVLWLETEKDSGKYEQLKEDFSIYAISYSEFDSQEQINKNIETQLQYWKVLLNLTDYTYNKYELTDITVNADGEQVRYVNIYLNKTAAKKSDYTVEFYFQTEEDSAEYQIDAAKTYTDEFNIESGDYNEFLKSVMATVYEGYQFNNEKSQFPTAADYISGKPLVIKLYFDLKPIEELDSVSGGFVKEHSEYGEFTLKFYSNATYTVTSSEFGVFAKGRIITDLVEGASDSVSYLEETDCLDIASKELVPAKNAARITFDGKAETFTYSSSNGVSVVFGAYVINFTFNLDGGKWTDEKASNKVSVILPLEKTYKLPEKSAVAKEGYDFVGWTPCSEDGTWLDTKKDGDAVEPLIYTEITSASVPYAYYKAVWTAKDVEHKATVQFLTLNEDGKSYEEIKDYTEEVSVTRKYDVPEAEWFKALEDEVQKVYKDFKLEKAVENPEYFGEATAEWNKDKTVYEVKFDRLSCVYSFYADEDSKEAFAELSGFYGTDVDFTKLTLPVKDGYELSGWVVSVVKEKEESESVKIDGSDLSNSDYAKYPAVSKITFIAQWQNAKAGFKVEMEKIQIDGTEYQLTATTDSGKIIFTAPEGFDSYSWSINGTANTEKTRELTVPTTSSNNGGIYQVVCVLKKDAKTYSLDGTVTVVSDGTSSLANGSVEIELAHVTDSVGAAALKYDPDDEKTGVYRFTVAQALKAADGTELTPDSYLWAVDASPIEDCDGPTFNFATENLNAGVYNITCTVKTKELDYAFILSAKVTVEK